MIEIQCPNCQRTLKVPEKYVGTEGACNYCGGRVHVAANNPAAGSVPLPVIQQDPGPLQALNEAQAEVQRLSETAEAERLARQKAECDRDAALAKVAELEQALAQEIERESSLTPRAELEKAQADLAESHEFAEWLGRELETQRGKTKQAQAQLVELRDRLAAIVDEMGATVADDASGEEANSAPGPSPRPDFTPDDAAAAILVGAGSAPKRMGWAWVAGLVAALLAVAAGIGVWGLVK